MMKMEKPPSVRNPLSTSSKPSTFCTSSMKRYFVPETASRGLDEGLELFRALTDRYPYRSRSKKTILPIIDAFDLQLFGDALHEAGLATAADAGDDLDHPVVMVEAAIFFR